jgi:Secretion system C-terminal sorting domain
MKNILQFTLRNILLIFAIIICNSSIAQIPNWNMESWTSTTKDIPSQWLMFGSITKVSPGQNGAYAVKLQGVNSQDYNNGPGAILYGNPNNNNGFDGGTPFTARPDSLIAYFKYNIDAGDSAWVILSFKKNGVAFSNDVYEYTGSYTNSFKRMAFKIHYDTNDIPDTVFVGFTSTNPNSNQINTNSWVIIDNISFVGTSQNVPNPDFENWTTQTKSTLDNWKVDKSSWGSNIERTTDAYAESYAMKLQSINTAAGTIQGYTQTINSNSNNNNGNWRPSFAINSTPNSLKGFFKFYPQNGDTFTVGIGLFKNGQQVGSGNYLSANALNTYTPISIPINYNSTPPDAPDSAIIQMATFAMTGNNNAPRGQSIAYIDNLSFDKYINTGIKGVTSQIDNLIIYPNPAQAKLNVKFELLQSEKVFVSMFDLNGREVLKLANQTFESGNYDLSFDISYFTNGLYFIVTQNGNSISHSKLIISK